MALHSAPPNEKLIFAPANSSQNSRADQYLYGTLSLHDLSPSPFTQFHTWFTAAQSPSPSTSTSTSSTSSSPQTPTVHQPETVCVSTSSLPSGRVSSRYVYLKELDARGFVFYSNWATSGKARDVASNPHASMAFWWREVERQVRVEGRLERLTTEESQRYYDLRARGSRVGAWASRQSRVLTPRVRGQKGAEGVALAAEKMKGVRLVEEQGAVEGEGGGDGGVEDQAPRNGNRDVEDEAEVDDGRGQLDEWVREVEARFAGQEHIPVPDFWGGTRLVPDRVEFWQGRNSRLHDRFVYTRIGLEEEGDAAVDKEARGNGEGEGEGESRGWKIERLSP